MTPTAISASWRSASQVADGVLKFHPHQDEQCPVDDEGGQRPERQCLRAVFGLDDARGDLGHDQAADDHREDAGRLDEFGQQVCGEGCQDHDQVAQQRIGQAAPQVHVDPCDRDAYGRPAPVGEQEQPADVRNAQVLLADRDADGQTVDDQRGAVVDQALRAQDGDLTARQGAGEDADRRRVRGRHGRTEHPRRPPRQPEGVPRRGDGPGGEDDEYGAQLQDATQVGADFPQGGGQALPVQQHRQEEQQHDVRGQLRVPQGRDEPQEHTRHEQDYGRGDAEALSHDVAHQHGHAQDHDEFETEQGASPGGVKEPMFSAVRASGSCPAKPPWDRRNSRRTGRT